MIQTARFKNSKIEIYDNYLSYKKLFKGFVKINFEEVKNMTSVFIQDGNMKYYNLTLFDNSWHTIKLNSFSPQKRLDIIDFMLKTIGQIALPKLMNRFDQNNEINLGSLIVKKSEGIIKTNNIKKQIEWKDINTVEFWTVLNGVGKGKIKFNSGEKEDIFEFLFDIGNLIKHGLMFEIFKNMIEQEKINVYSN